MNYNILHPFFSRENAFSFEKTTSRDLTNSISDSILSLVSLHCKPNDTTNYTEWHIIVNQELNMKDLEQKAFRSTFQDGLVDIFIGLLLIAISSNIFFARESVSWGYIIPQAHIVTIGIYALIVVFRSINQAIHSKSADRHRAIRKSTQIETPGF